MEVFFQHQVVAVERGVELGEGFERGHAGFDDESQWREFHAFALPLFVELFAEAFQLGHVGFVVYGNVWNHYPVARQVLAGNLLDTAELFHFDFAEFGEIHFRPRQQIQAAAQRSTGSCRLACTALHGGFNEGFDVVFGDAAFIAAAFHQAQIHAQFARQFAGGGAGMGFGETGFVHGCAAIGGGSRSGRRSRGRSRSCSRRGSGFGRFGRGGSSSGRCAGSGYVDDDAAFRHLVAHFDVNGGNGAGSGARHIHSSFVGFQSDQGVVYGHGVAHFHFHSNHVHIGVAADIGHGYLNIGGGGRSCGGRSRCGSGFGLGCGSRSGSSACTGGFHQYNHIAFGDFVAYFHLHFFHDTGRIRRHVHGGFIGFQGNQCVV